MQNGTLHKDTVSFLHLHSAILRVPEKTELSSYFYLFNGPKAGSRYHETALAPILSNNS